MRLLPLLLVGAQASRMASRAQANRTSPTIVDKILINGQVVMESEGIQLGCHTAPRNAIKVTVCGPAVKVIASLLTECQPYGRYSHEVGFCDNGKGDACQTSPLESGYT